MTDTSAPIHASLIAKWFIARASIDAEQDLSNLKLQKLLYLAQSSFVNEHGTPLIKEDFQAWDHGPAIGVVYREYKVFRSSPILLELSDDGPWTHLSELVTMTLNRTWDDFAGYSALKLQDITHRLGPWASLYQSNVKHLVISDDSIGEAWPKFAALAAKPVNTASSPELRAVLDHFEKVLSILPQQEAKGDPSFLLAELDALEELRIHAASQLL